MLFGSGGYECGFLWAWFVDIEDFTPYIAYTYYLKQTKRIYCCRRLYKCACTFGRKKFFVCFFVFFLVLFLEYSNADKVFISNIILC